MKRNMILVAAILMVPAFALAQWSENFDSYANGSGMHGQGGWKGWDNSARWDAPVTNAQSVSAPHSVDISGPADLVHEYAGYTSGQWVYSVQQYIPSDMVGDSYFILLNTYNDGGAKNWSTQILFNTTTIESTFEGVTLPSILDQWVELRVEIDLDADSQSIYYGGQLLSTKSWTDGVSGGGALNIGAVDLFANGATVVYYDDISLMPAPVLVEPDSFSLFRGLLVGGGLSDLFASDDSWMTVQEFITFSPDERKVQLIVEGTSPTETPSELRFRLEAHASTVNIGQWIDLWNYDTSMYEEVDMTIATLVDSIVEVSATGDLSRFVEAGSKKMKARLSYHKVGPVFVFPWLISFDQTVWVIVP